MTAVPPITTVSTDDLQWLYAWAEQMAFHDSTAGEGYEPPSPVEAREARERLAEIQARYALTTIRPDYLAGQDDEDTEGVPAGDLPAAGTLPTRFHPVPPIEAHIEGLAYYDSGYSYQRDFDFRCAVLSPTEVSVCGETLDPTGAARLARALRVEPPAPDSPLNALTVEMYLDLGGALESAALRGSHLLEIADWLDYALGTKAWDPDVEEWEW